MRPARVRSAVTPRGAAPPSPKRNVGLIVVAAIGSIAVPGFLLLRRPTACNGASEEGGALRALVLLAQRNAEAINELSRAADPVDRDLVAVLERAIGNAPLPAAAADAAAAAAPLLSEEPLVSSARPLAEAAAALLPSSSSSSSSSPPVWLRLAMLSVGRKGGEDYLLRSLRSIVEQLPTTAGHPLRDHVDVVSPS